MVLLTGSQDQPDGIEKPKQYPVDPRRTAVLVLWADGQGVKRHIVSAARQSDHNGNGSWRPRGRTQRLRARGARPPHRIQQG